MKRCPQCEFIYEESQKHCDMDGAELVHAAKPIPSLKRPTKHTSRLVKSQKRKLAVRGAAIVLGAILSVAFYGFMHQSPPENLDLSSAQIAPRPSALLSTTAESDKALHSKVENQVLAELAQPASPSPGRSAQLLTTKARATNNSSPKVTSSPARSRLPAPRREVRRSEAIGAANHRSESKVGSFLRKTGRLLKKPFKR